MDYHSNHVYIRRPIARERNPQRATRWVKEWVPQEIAATGKRCYLLKWVREDMLIALTEKFKEAELEETEPEPTTEILFLCNYEGCNRAFPNEAQQRKHALTHGERQHACSSCPKKFLDSSKLKRHQVVHTGEKKFMCTICHKAFNLDFNLRAHMKTHSEEHYHACPYTDCDKRYTQECKLKSHIKARHEKNTTVDVVKHTVPADKLRTTPKPPGVVYRSPSSDRPFVCPYEGCGKDYIHEYKLNLHLRDRHGGHSPEYNGRRGPVVDNTVGEGSDQDAYLVKSAAAKNLKRKKPDPVHKVPPTKLAYSVGSPFGSVHIRVPKQQLPSQEMSEDDSEETEEDNGIDEDDSSSDDDEETEDEN